MEAAGATILGRRDDEGAMGLGALKRAGEVRKLFKRFKQWLNEYRVLSVVVVDSPAANFPVAKAVKKAKFPPFDGSATTFTYPFLLAE